MAHSIARAMANGGPPPTRRLIAVGTISNTRGRTTRVTVTEAGVTGSIRSAVTR